MGSSPIDFDGIPLTRENLPPPTTTRWVIGRKAMLVNAVVAGIIQREEVLEIYSISDEEFSSWESKMQRSGGRHNLRVTRYDPQRERRLAAG